MMGSGNTIAEGQWLQDSGCYKMSAVQARRCASWSPLPWMCVQAWQGMCNASMCHPAQETPAAGQPPHHAFCGSGESPSNLGHADCTMHPIPYSPR